MTAASRPEARAEYPASDPDPSMLSNTIVWQSTYPVNRRVSVAALFALPVFAMLGCTGPTADPATESRTDKSLLSKLIRLDPLPSAARWSMSSIGRDSDFGPTDNILWALLRYADADLPLIVSALETRAPLRSVTVASVPAWVLAEVDLRAFRRGQEYDFSGRARPATPYQSSLYGDGFAVTVPDNRVLVRSVTR